MGLFIKDTVKAQLGRKKVTTSYIITAVCAVLIAANVGLFLLFPRIVAPIAIVLSNVITITLMLFAIQPINNLIQGEFDKKAHALVEKETEERAMQERLSNLENRNRELESRLDTWSQTAASPADVNLSFKVETMTYDKTGYIVKEEPLERFMNDPAYKIADKRAWSDRLSRLVDNITHPGQKKVLYIGKYYVKASIGLDFTKIKYSEEGGVTTLFGVRFSKLNNLAIERDPADVNLCWLINEEGDGEVSINRADVYRDFTDAYAEARSRESDMALEGEVNAICERYTAVFRENLSARFPGIRFTDSIEDSSATWYSLKDPSRGDQIKRIAANMLLMAEALGGYVSGGEKLLDIRR